MARAARLLLLAVAAWLYVAAVGQDDKVLPFNPSCSTTGNYTADSQYKKNLDELLSALSTVAGSNGWFSKKTVGTGPDQVFGLIMCYADRNATQCQDCLDRAPAGITTICPFSRTVRANYDACLLRYSDVAFFDTADRSYNADFNISFFVYSSPYVKNMTSMNSTRSQLMNRLAKRAGDEDLRLDNGSQPYTDLLLGTQAMYGLAQCTRDLAPSECTSCLSNYAGLLSQIFRNNSGGAIKGYSCYLRYELRAFDITLPPPRSLPPSSPLPPSPEGAPSPSVSTGLVAGLSVGSVSLIVLGLLIWLLLRRRRNHTMQTREQELQEGNIFEDETTMEDDF